MPVQRSLNCDISFHVEYSLKCYVYANDALNERGQEDQSNPGVNTLLRTETSGSEPEYPERVAIFSAEKYTLAA